MRDEIELERCDTCGLAFEDDNNTTHECPPGFLEPIIERPKPDTDGGDGDTIIVYRDGTWKQVKAASAWEYENDPDYLVTIPAVADRSAYPADKEQVK